MNNLKQKKEKKNHGYHKNHAKIIVLTIAFFATLTVSAQDVYVGGMTNSQAAVWKNGTPTTLSTNDGVIKSVVVDNGIVYATGQEKNESGKWVAKVWKDDAVLYVLNDGTADSYVNSIAIANGVVYVAGAAIEGACVGKMWKNGVPEENYTEAIELYSVFISGNDVYAAGQIVGGNAAVWKNGTLLYLIESEGSGNYNLAASVAVDGDKVYTVVYQQIDYSFTHTVWENDAVLYTLATDLPYYNSQSGIYLSNGNIYVTGFDKNEEGVSVAKLWINGDGTDLTDGTTDAFACSVFVSGDDVYVTGMENYSNVLLWKNGEMTILAEEYMGCGSSVFVVPSPPTITTTSLPIGAINIPYNTKLTATGTTPIKWTLNGGALPKGLDLYQDGTIAGTPAELGWANFTVKAENSMGNDAKTLSIFIDEKLGIGEIATANITVYPNPTSGELIIEICDMRYEICDIAIFDVMGRNVSGFGFRVSGSVFGGHPPLGVASRYVVLNISDLPAGIYFLRIQTENDIITKKIIKK